MPARSKNVLVTGGAGFIGSHLVERLLQDGHAVTVIDDCSTGRLENLASVKNNSRLRVVVAKISACKKLDQLVRGSTGIYHLAAAVGVEMVLNSAITTIKNNLWETERLLEAAGSHRTPILIASTSEVYGKSAKAAFSEEDDLLIGPPYLSRWSYACSKLMDEFLALAHFRERGTPIVVARLFNTVGPRQTGRYGMVLPRFIEAAKRNKPLKVFGNGKQTRCFCYVDDTVEALVRLQNCAQARGQVFNVGGTQEVSIRGLAELIIDTLGSNSHVQLVPYSRAYPPGFEDMLRRKPVIRKLAKYTAFSPKIRLKTIIQRTAAAASIQ